ncbi:MAG: hypothetical protein K8S87_11555 [Planctomycetes bacterium]|nr:hypothetical protein [Planctomycetota bacterium]
MNKDCAEFLVSTHAIDVLREIEAKFIVRDEFRIANFLDRNAGFSIEERTALMEMYTQRIRAKAKLPMPDCWLFERTALEQASSHPTAIFHRIISRICGKNVENAEILDGCAGLGIDSHYLGAESVGKTHVYCDAKSVDFFHSKDETLEKSEIPGFEKILVSEKEAKITAVEQNEALFILMRKNLEKLRECSCINQDVAQFLSNSTEIDKFGFMYFDPSRRTAERKRIPDIENYSPAPSRIIKLLKNLDYNGSIGFKLAPTFMKLSSQPANNIEWDEDVNIFAVSYKNEIKETFVLYSKNVSGQKFAVVLKYKQDCVEVFIVNAESASTNDLPVKMPVDGYLLIHPAPALRALELIPTDIIEKSDKLSKIEFGNPLILAESLIPSKIAQNYEIISVTKPDYSEVKRELHKKNCYAFSVKSYGCKSADFGLEKLAKSKGKPAYLFIVKTSEGLRCLITRNVKTGD